jgi:hypothetical protein
MTKYYGVICELCGRKFFLEKETSDNAGTVASYAIPLTPIPCACGGSYLYDELMEFMEEDDNLPLTRVPHAESRILISTPGHDL